MATLTWNAGAAAGWHKFEWLQDDEAPSSSDGETRQAGGEGPDASAIPTTLPPAGRAISPALAFAAGAIGAAFVTPATAAASSTGTATLQGSGLTFNNTYGAGITSAYVSDIVDAEHALEAICTNNCSVNVSFDVGATSPGDSAQNSFPDSIDYNVAFSTYLAALKSHVSSAAAQTAVDAITAYSKTYSNDDPTGGQGVSVPLGLAEILGLKASDSAIDDTITLSSGEPWSAASGVTDGSDVISTLEHEITEGCLGRIGALGIAQIGYQAKAWAPMDFFRYNASGVWDPTPLDGKATYFSLDGSGINSSTSLQFHNGATDGADFADWDQVGPDITATDSFGPRGGGYPASLSATDILIMQALGYTPASELAAGSSVSLVNPSASNGQTDQIRFNVTNNGLGDSRASTVGVYLSADSTITTSDTLIGTYSLGAIGYGQTASETASFTLPSNLTIGANYHIGVIVDYNNQLIDADAADNASGAATLGVTPPTFVWQGGSGDWYSSGWSQPIGGGLYGTPDAGDIADIRAAGSGAYTVTADNVTITTTDNSTFYYDTWETGELLLGASATLLVAADHFNIDSDIESSGDLLIDTALTVGPSASPAGAIVTLEPGASGAGTITLSDQYVSSIVGASSSVTLKNEGETIRGGGTISGLTFDNDSGTVDATSASVALTLDPVGSFFNYGLLEATAAGGLSLSSQIDQQRFANIAGPGIIKAAGANAIVYLNGGTRVVGGTITTANGGIVETVNGATTFDGTSSAGVTGVKNTGTLDVGDGSSLTIAGNLANSGTIETLSPYYGVKIVIDSSGAFLSGAGEIAIDAGATLVGGSTTSAASLLNSSNIVGAGSLGIGDGSLALTNRGAGIIDSTSGLTVNTDAQVLNNSGLLEATTGVLTIDSQKVTQSGGTIFADGSNVVLAAVDVQGGLLKTDAGGEIVTSGVVTYDGVASQINNSGATEVADGSNLTLLGVINNTGTIHADDTYYGAQIFIARGGATLKGGGTISLNAALFDHAAASTFSSVYNVDNTITGVGAIGSGDNKLGLTNESVIVASGGTLTINTGNTLHNADMLESASASVLAIDQTTIEEITTYGTGLLLADDGSDISLASATIHGGKLDASGDGYYVTADGGSVLEGTGGVSIAVNALVSIVDGTALTLDNAIVNNATIALTGSYYGARLIAASGGAKLTGGGEITMAGGNNEIVGGSGQTLTNVDNTISGGGNLGDGTNGLAFVNKGSGTIDASDASIALVIETGSANLVNSGLIEATGKAGLVISACEINQSSGGELVAGDGSSAFLNTATILGGTLQSNGAGVFMVGGSAATVDGVTLDGTIGVGDGESLTLVHAIDVAGEIDLTGTYYGARLVSDDATLEGGGKIVMTGGVNTFVGAPASTLTNYNDVISGAGAIGDSTDGISFVNDAAGVVNANNANGFTIETGSVALLNAGLIEATSAATLTILNSTIDQSSGGKLVAGAGSSVALTDATVLDGTLQSNGSGVFAVAGAATLDGLANTGKVVVADGYNLTLAHTIVNSSQIDLTGSYYGARLISDNAKLSGGGKVAMTGGVDALVGSFGATLTNVDNVISGTGAIGDGSVGLKFVNDANGVVNASSASTQFAVNTYSVMMTNAGLFEATGAAGLLVVNSTMSQSGGGRILAADGSHVDLNGATILGGQLQSAGTGVFQALGTGSILGELASSASIHIGDGAALIATAINNSGTFTIDGSYYGASLAVSGSWSGAGAIAMSDFGGNKLTLQGNWSDGANIVSGAGLIGGPGTAKLTNGGAIEAIDADDSLTISTGATVANNGLFEGLGGALAVDDNVIGSGSALVKGGGSLAFEGTFNEDVAFQGANAGSLTLSKSDSGAISGFRLGDSIELAGVSATSAMLDGSNALIVKQGTTTVATLNLVGSYAGVSFKALANAGGVEIVELASPTVAQYLANPASYDAMANGFGIGDTAANVIAHLAALKADSHLVSIVSTSGAIALSTAQFKASRAALDKVVGGFAIADTAANAGQSLGALASDAKIVSLTLSGGPLSVSAATFNADQPLLDKIAGGFAVSDTGAHLAASFNALKGDAAHIKSVHFTGAGTPSISLTAAQAAGDAGLLGKIAGGYVVNIHNANGSWTTTGHGDNLTIPVVAGLDLMTGGGGGETFVLQAGFGKATLVDFHSHTTGSAHDVVSLQKSEFNYLKSGMTQAQDLAAVLNHASVSGANLTITDTNPSHNVLTIDGISKTTLLANAGDFRFV